MNKKRVSISSCLLFCEFPTNYRGVEKCVWRKTWMKDINIKRRKMFFASGLYVHPSLVHFHKHSGKIKHALCGGGIIKIWKSNPSNCLHSTHIQRIPRAVLGAIIGVERVERETCWIQLELNFIFQLKLFVNYFSWNKRVEKCFSKKILKWKKTIQRWEEFLVEIKIITKMIDICGI